MQQQPMTYEQMMEMVKLGGQNAQLDQQMAQQVARAKLLREGGAPGMRQAGRVSVAPHVLETLGHLMKQYGAMKAEKGATDLAGQKTANQQQQFAALLQAMMANRGPGVNPAQGLQLPMGGAGMQMGGGMGMKPPMGY